jgi:hypothetical protein
LNVMPTRANESSTGVFAFCPLVPAYFPNESQPMSSAIINSTLGLSDVIGVIAGVVSFLQANENNRRNVMVLKVMWFFI